MKIIKLLASVTLAILLWYTGMWILGVPADLPMYRWLSGICCLAFSLIASNYVLSNKL